MMKIFHILLNAVFLCCVEGRDGNLLRGDSKHESNNFLLESTTDSGYQNGAIWSHSRGNSNLNTGQSSFYGPTKTPSISWEYNTSAYTYSASTPAVAADGTIYMPLGSRLFAFSSQGSIQWKFVANYTIHSSPAIHQNGMICFGATIYIYCVSSSGSSVFSISTSHTEYSNPAIANDGTIYFLCTYFLYSVSSTGSVNWSYNHGGSIGNYFDKTPAIGTDGTIYFGNQSPYLFAISSSGFFLWKFYIGGNIVSSPAIGSDGTIYIGSSEGYLNAIFSIGSYVWYTFVNYDIDFASPAISQDGSTIYVGGKMAVFYAVSASTGSVIWKRSVGNYIYSSPTVGADGTIYVGCVDSKLYALTSEGNVLWTFTESSPVYSSPVIGGNGIIYTASEDGHLYALTGEYSAPSISPSAQASSSSSLSSGAVAGIVIGLLAFLSCFLVSLYVYMTKYTSQSNHGNGENTTIEDPNKHLEESPRDSMLSSTNPHQLALSRSKALTQSTGVYTKHASFVKIGHQYGYLNNTTDNSKEYINGAANSLSSTSNKKSTIAGDFVPAFSWTDIELMSLTLEDAIIGKGSFGFVILAKLNAKDPTDGVTLITKDDVVVKVFTKSILATKDAVTTQKLLEVAIQEVSILLNAESRIYNKNCIVKVFGITAGALPPDICQKMNVVDTAEAIGIVMRYEKGGTLDAWIHPAIVDNNEQQLSILSMKDKFRLLSEIARGIAELHAAGIVHGDIKPDNILLSSKNILEAEIRLADFGLAAVREEISGFQGSTMGCAPINTRGTPLYCAPEMLVNPFIENYNDKVAKASRQTDVYAFAILAWEVLTEKKPFQDYKKEIILSGKVHQGYRPPVSDIPDDCPRKIVTMITDCWDSERSRRHSATECYTVLKHCYGLMVNTVYDVYLICHSKKTGFSDCIYNSLTQRGLNVLFINQHKSSAGSVIVGIDSNKVIDDINTTIYSSNDRASSVTKTTNEENEIIAGISSSQILLVCIDRSFQDEDSSLFEIKEARKMKLQRQIVPLFIDADYKSWLNDEVKYNCRMGDASKKVFDVSESTSDSSWLSDNGPSVEAIASLNTEMVAVSEYVRQQLNSTFR